VSPKAAAAKPEQREPAAWVLRSIFHAAGYDDRAAAQLRSFVRLPQRR
jgi:hypothetical protein